MLASALTTFAGHESSGIFLFEIARSHRLTRLDVWSFQLSHSYDALKDTGSGPGCSTFVDRQGCDP